MSILKSLNVEGELHITKKIKENSEFLSNKFINSASSESQNKYKINFKDINGNIISTIEFPSAVKEED